MVQLALFWVANFDKTGQKEIQRCTFSVITASVEDWSFYGNDVPQSDTDQAIEGCEWKTR